MDRYRDVPVISADDDCIYTCNYAEKLYQTWIKNKNRPISAGVYRKYGYVWTHGQYTLYPPNCFKNFALKNLNLCFKLGFNDDAFIAGLYNKLKIDPTACEKIKLLFHTSVKPLSPKGNGTGYNAKKDISNFIKWIKL